MADRQIHTFPPGAYGLGVGGVVAVVVVGVVVVGVVLGGVDVVGVPGGVLDGVCAGLLAGGVPTAKNVPPSSAMPARRAVMRNCLSQNVPFAQL
jgi:hypothetical protein